jgi:hypothetical protein
MNNYKRHRVWRGVRYVAAGKTAPRTFAAPMTCGHCGRTWDDAHSSGWTPVPSGRCPFEFWHWRASRILRKGAP